MSRIILRDGKVAELRQARDTDEDRRLVRDLFSRASPDSLYYRFFHAIREVSDRMVRDMIAGDGYESYGLLCTAGEKALAIGTYARTNEDTAEVAFLVDDELHGKGLGTLLLEHLADAAWKRGFRQFEAYVLSENHQMMHVFQSSGYEIKGTYEMDRVHLVLPLGETERSRALALARDKLATLASLEPFFRPKRVAVVGASRDSGSIGNLLLRQLVAADFHGTVYPINASAQSVAGFPCLQSLSLVPEPVDLAVIAVPAPQVEQVVDDCVRARVRGVVIISAGFAESGPSGSERQERIVRKLRAAGIRLIGPNCLGLINTSDDVRLHLLCTPRTVQKGHLAIASQSGGLGVAMMAYAEQSGVGVASFVSMGNKADVSSNDLVQYWEDDANVKLIALYLESFGNPRRFSRIARRLTKTKPIIAVKSARTPGGARVSEAGGMALLAEDRTVAALFQQTGIIRVDTLQELFDVTAVLTESPLPAGRRVAVVTNSAGGAVMAVDALQQEGMQFVGPPVDLGFEALAQGYRTVLPEVLLDEGVDAVVVLFIPVGQTDETPVSKAILDGVAAADRLADERGVPRKPVVANLLATEHYLVRYIDAPSRRIPVFPFPEQAARALAKAAVYSAYRQQPLGHLPDLPSLHTEQARRVVRGLQTTDPRVLPESEATSIFDAAGLRQVSWRDSAERVALNETQNVHLRVTVAELFGPTMELYSARLIPRSGWEFTSFQTPIAALVPLTDLDASRLANEVMEQSKTEVEQASDKVLKDGLASALLYISRLIEEIPELHSVECTLLPQAAGDTIFTNLTVSIAATP